MGQRYRTTFANLNTIIQAELANKFEYVDFRKPKMAVSSPFFNGMSIQEQKELVMEIMPENIKEEIDLETRCLPYDEDKKVLWLLLNKNLFQTFTIPENLQSLLDDAVFYFERQNGVKALEATRKCVSLQFRNFLIANELDTDDHKISSRIVRFLVKTDNRDRFLSERLSTSWAKLEQVYTSTYEDDYKLDEIMEILTSAETFCNNIYSIRKKKSFKRDDLLNWLTESLMVELKIPIDGNWKKIKEWINEGKIKLEGERPHMQIIKL
ncbi:hypothetical protein ACQ4LE_010495 [Meloidogyne hapla]